MTFFLSTHPYMQARVAHMSLREESGDNPSQAVVYAASQPSAKPDLEDYLGGGGLFTLPRELFKAVQALLKATGPSASDAASIPPGHSSAGRRPYPYFSLTWANTAATPSRR